MVKKSTSWIPEGMIWVSALAGNNCCVLGQGKNMYFNLIVHWGGFKGRAEQPPPPPPLPVFPLPSCFLTNPSFDRYRCFIVYTVIRVF